MVPRVLAVAEQLCREIESFTPALYSGADCALLAEALSKTEKACAGARARAAARAVTCGAHKERGFADGADWLAQKTGSSRAEARSDLDTAGSLEDLPATADALAKGEVSMKEAAEVAKGEAARPGSESELVGLAKSSGLGVLKDEVRRRALEAQAAEDLAARQHRARYFRHWRDELGLVRFSGALPPTVGIGIANRIEAEAARLHRGAGPAGNLCDPRTGAGVAPALRPAPGLLPHQLPQPKLGGNGAGASRGSRPGGVAAAYLRRRF